MSKIVHFIKQSFNQISYIKSTIQLYKKYISYLKIYTTTNIDSWTEISFMPNLQFLNIYCLATKDSHSVLLLNALFIYVVLYIKYQNHFLW